MEVYQHFRVDEQPFIDQVISWKDEVDIQHQNILSDFLDPREQHILTTLVGNDENMSLVFDGAYEEAERKRARLVPYYQSCEESDFNIIILEGTYPTKFVNLSHGDLLGTLMSLGIQRKKVGDLIVKDGTFQIICDQHLAMYIQLQLTKIKNTSVKLIETPRSRLLQTDSKWVEKEGTVSSTRLDVLMKQIYNLSRQKSQTLIEKEIVKVNHRMVKEASFNLKAGDLISVRSFGRGKVIEILGETKKQKLKIKTAKLK
ncbi:RNA-binding protein [Halalkalibacillus halophilus]|uniref:YlmH family RNA-binding protein n=1 Tax=Halalkalibacillus halophilus TaxID=392827 RepID=UPI0003FDEBF2|nr:YlmH/Sll1252 family protein [Halalkalibacillus halophilus]